MFDAGHLTVSCRCTSAESNLLTSLLKLFPRPLLKSSVGPLTRYCSYQEITSRSGPERGHYSSQAKNAGGPTDLQGLGRYGTLGNHSRRPEQMYTPYDTRLEWLGEGPLFKLDSIKCWNAKMQPIFVSFPGP